MMYSTYEEEQSLGTLRLLPSHEYHKSKVLRPEVRGQGGHTFKGREQVTLRYSLITWTYVPGSDSDKDKGKEDSISNPGKISMTSLQHCESLE